MLKIRGCKVNGCLSRHKALGYCNFHYRRVSKNIPLVRNCLFCHKELGKCERKFCSTNHFRRYHYIMLSKEEKRKILQYYRAHYISVSVAGVRSYVFTNGVTQEIKPLIPKIRNKVLNDCIRNPRKYLE